MDGREVSKWNTVLIQYTCSGENYRLNAVLNNNAALNSGMSFDNQLISHKYLMLHLCRAVY